MKLAILILLHEYTEQQKKLISHLATDFDVFVHIDKKSSVRIDEVLNKRVFAYKKYKVYWGSYNQILATLLLFYEAYSHGHYDRYVLISGSDIPLVSNRALYNFFDDNTVNYFEHEILPRDTWHDNGGFDRIDFYWPNVKSHGSYCIIEKLIYGVMERFDRWIIIPIMRALKIHRRKNIDYYGGANWMDLTAACVSQILDFVNVNKKFVRSFRYTRCADELFFQTVICNYVSDIKSENRCLRYVDFSSGPEYPRIMRIEDFKHVIKSGALFARKCDARVDGEFIKKMYEDCLENEC